MGTEEQTVIAPAVQEAVGRGLDVVGPLSADALFYYAFRGEYDAVVAMYHDQGLAPLKMVAFEHGVDWTLERVSAYRLLPDWSKNWGAKSVTEAKLGEERVSLFTCL